MLVSTGYSCDCLQEHPVLDNKHPGYSCDCLQENILDSFIDYILLNRSPCGVNGFCANKHPGYSCDCLQGYEFDGTTCIDTNECLDNACQNGVCINKEGSFQCQCFEGYKHDEYGICIDINECMEVNYTMFG